MEVAAWTAEPNALETAEKIGVSRATVERVRAVMVSDAEPVKETLRNGAMTRACRSAWSLRRRRMAEAEALPVGTVTLPCTLSKADT